MMTSSRTAAASKIEFSHLHSGGRHERARLLPLGLVLSLILLPTSSAIAAGALCKANAVGQPAEAATEIEAKRQALASWFALAGAHGPEYTRWGIAWNRQLACTRTAAKGFRCQATGQPCTIVQVIPDDAKRLLRGPAPIAPEPDPAGPARQPVPAPR